MSEVTLSLNATPEQLLAIAVALNSTPAAQPGIPVPSGTVSAVPTPATPNTLTVALSSSPGADQDCTVSIIVNGKAVDPLVAASARVGQSLQGCTVKKYLGNWGDNPTVQIAPVPPGGNNGLWIMAVNYDGVPLVANGIYDSRGGRTVNSEWCYVTAQNTVTYGQPVAVAPPPPPLAAPLFPAISADLTGTGQTVDATGHRLTYDKAILVPTVPGLTIKNLVLTGARLPTSLGANGAGVRDAGDGIGFTLDGVEIHHCDNGILTFASNISLLNCKFHDNGSAQDDAPGMTHNVYVGGGNLIVKNYTGYGATRAHDIKSRAVTTSISQMVSTAGGQGRCLDVPDAGTVDVTDSVWTIPPGAADRTFFGYATESGKNAGRIVTLTNVVFIDQTGQGGFITCGPYAPDAVLNLIGCTYKGAAAPQFQGWPKVNGELTQAGAS